MARPRLSWHLICIGARTTIRAIVATKERSWTSGIAASTGALGFLAVSLSARDHMSLSFPPRVVLRGTLLAAPAAIALLYTEAGLWTLSGRALGGNGAFARMPAAVARSWIPLTWLCLLALPFFGFARLFRVTFQAGQITLIRTPAGLVLAGLTWIALAANFFISVRCIADVHSISAWKGAEAKLMAVAALTIGAAVGLCALAIGYVVARAIYHMI